MKHSKQLTLLLATLLVLLLLGVVFYLYLLSVERSDDQSQVTEELTSGPLSAGNDESAIRARLEAAMSTDNNTSPEEEVEIKNRLQAAMASSTPPTAEEQALIRARLQAAVSQ